QGGQQHGDRLIVGQQRGTGDIPCRVHRGDAGGKVAVRDEPVDDRGEQVQLATLDRAGEDRRLVPGLDVFEDLVGQQHASTDHVAVGVVALVVVRFALLQGHSPAPHVHTGGGEAPPVAAEGGRVPDEDPLVRAPLDDIGGGLAHVLVFPVGQVPVHERGHHHAGVGGAVDGVAGDRHAVD